MRYYIVKSGMQMYDLSKAYGLGSILQTLSGSIVTIKDFGHYYLVNTQTKCDLKKIENLSMLLPDETDKKWSYLFLTLNKKERTDKIKNCQMIKNKKIVSLILNKFKDIKQPEFGSEKKGRETLYQSMDLSATKGFREKIRGIVYREGTQLYVPTEDFLLSVIGHLNFTIWKKGQEQLISILFNPSTEGIWISGEPDARRIVKNIDESIKTHRAGILATLSYAATSLAKEISLQKERRFSPKFSNLIFGVMVASGQRTKPYSGGIYPLDFLYKIINSTEKAIEIFDQWIEIFRLTNQPGYEDLAISLSEFITFPSQSTLEKYLKTHLGIFLNKKIKPKLYEEDIIKEIIKNV